MLGCTGMFDIVFVCTGNRARSPLAEALCLRYTAGVDLRVRSAGTLGVRGLPPLADAIRAGRALGVDIASHRTRSLDDVELRSVDLVLGFEPFHVQAAVAAGVSADRAFLLGELVALLGRCEQGGDVVARARESVARAHARRARALAAATATIADPLGRSAGVMKATAREIDDLVHSLAVALFVREPA